MVGCRAVRRRVVGSHHLVGVLESVDVVEDVEELGVGVGILLAGVGVRGIHPDGDAVRHRASHRAVLGPVRHRIAEVLADHSLERLDFPGGVEAPEQIVERTVLEEHQHHVVHRIRSYRGHESSLHGGGGRPYAIAALGGR